jgi:GNAT superfamily N-acetyltransferase
LKSLRNPILKARLVTGKNLPVTAQDLLSLRQAVGWSVKGDYESILKEDLFHITARLEGKLVGFLPVTGSPHGDLLIYNMCVHPEVQGKGVGTCLVEMALEACRELNPLGINVLFEAENRPFFERFGFRIMHGGYMNLLSTTAKP